MQGTTKTQRPNFNFFQATLSKCVWELVVKVINKFENCDWKNLQTLTNKPEFKQSYQKFVQCRLLELVLDEKITVLGIKGIAMRCLRSHSILKPLEWSCAVLMDIIWCFARDLGREVIKMRNTK